MADDGIWIDLDDALTERVRRFAVAVGTPVDTVIRHAAADYIDDWTEPSRVWRSLIERATRWTPGLFWTISRRQWRRGPSAHREANRSADPRRGIRKRRGI